MNDPLTAIENLTLTPEDRLLREAHFEDENGNLTPTGKAALVNLLWKENRAVIVKKLQEVKAAEKAAQNSK